VPWAHAGAEWRAVNADRGQWSRRYTKDGNPAGGRCTKQQRQRAEERHVAENGVVIADGQLIAERSVLGRQRPYEEADYVLPARCEPAAPLPSGQPAVQIRVVEVCCRWQWSERHPACGGGRRVLATGHHAHVVSTSNQSAADAEQRHDVPVNGCNGQQQPHR